MSRGSNRIDEERVSIDSLVDYLKWIDPNSTVEVREEADDPPDYWLVVRQRRFAVEVTSIVPDQGYRALCDYLHQSIKKQCESDLSFTGKYALEISRRPDVPKRDSTEWRTLVAAAVANVKALATSAPSSELRLAKDSNGHLNIYKWSDEGRTFGMCGTPEGKYEGEVQAELAKLLEQSILKKHQKIQNKGVLTTCPDVILLLYDAYGYSDIPAATRALSAINVYDWLHSIFWAASFSDRTNTLYPESPGRSGRFLYSKDDNWRQKS